GRALRLQLRRDGGDRRLEDLAEPAARSGGFGHRRAAGAVEPRAVAGQVVEQPPRLILLRMEAGQVEEPSPVVAGLDDLRVEHEPHFAVARYELDFLDVEPELVQPAQARLEPAA